MRKAMSTEVGAGRRFDIFLDSGIAVHTYLIASYPHPPKRGAPNYLRNAGLIGGLRKH